MKKTQILTFVKPRTEIDYCIANMLQYWESVGIIDINDATPAGWCVLRLLAEGWR